MHKWGSSVFVILLFLHMGRVFLFGRLQVPARDDVADRRAILFLLVMVMSLTGYLLVFDQRAYWATVVGVNINGTAPILGPYIAKFLKVGPEFADAHAVTLLLAAHAGRSRAAIIALIGLHLWLVVTPRRHVAAVVEATRAEAREPSSAAMSLRRAKVAACRA